MKHSGVYQGEKEYMEDTQHISVQWQINVFGDYLCRALSNATIYQISFHSFKIKQKEKEILVSFS